MQVTSYALKQIAIYATTVCIFYLTPVRLDSESYFEGVLTAGMLAGLAYSITNQLRKQEQRFFDLVALMFVAAHGCAFACYVLAVQEPGQFSGITTRTDALYFTIVTMSTVGFGDVHPFGQEAKILVMVMIIFDLVFLAALAHAMSESLQKAHNNSTENTKK